MQLSDELGCTNAMNLVFLLWHVHEFADGEDEFDEDEDEDPADGYRGAEDRSAGSRMSRATGA